MRMNSDAVTARVLGGITIALGLVLSAALLLLNFNPFNFAFETSITIANDSGRAIKVSPIGIAEGSGRLSPLPQYAFMAPAFPAIRLGGFDLASGSELEIGYDWDDIIFTSVVIEAEGLKPRELIVEPLAKVESCCYVPKNVSPRITNLDSLPLARPEAVRVVENDLLNPRAVVLWLPALGPMLLVAGCLLVLPRSYWRRSESRRGSTRDAA
jgi:hypothetical protein